MSVCNKCGNEMKSIDLYNTTPYDYDWLCLNCSPVIRTNQVADEDKEEIFRRFGIKIKS